MAGTDRSGNRLGRWLATLSIVVLTVVTVRMWDESRDATSANAAPRDVASRGDLLPGERATIDLFKSASKSVVWITTANVRRDRITLDVLELPRGTGSGFVWDNQGHIVTNFHVVEGADSAKVALADHSVWRATLVGVAPTKDLAVLKIDAPTNLLQPIPVGRSDDLQVGQSVLAIGNPFGLDQTLTTGIISGLNRMIRSVTGRPIDGVIQTDAAINPGNSGGPLLDSAGRLIGVNTAIVSPSGAYAGIGFAVPVDTVNRIVPQIIERGKPIRPGLGVSVAPDALAQRLSLKGVLVMDLVQNGAAAKAGLQPTRRDESGRIILGDIILAIDGKPVPDNDALFNIIDRYNVGDMVTLTLQRNEKEIQVKAKLQELE